MGAIHHKEKGEGHPLVLIHGFCETSQLWDRLAENLSETYRVLMPDLPGFGESSLLPIPFTLSDVSLIMLDWLNEVEVRHPVVIGHSLGGYITLAMVEKHPDRFPGFGLFHSTAYADSSEKKENRNKTIDFVKRNGVQPYIETFVPGLFYQKKNPFIAEVFEMAARTSEETLVSYAEAMRDRPSTEKVLEIFSKPILMIAGEQDTIVPYEPASAQSNLMKYPFFCGLTDVGHMGMFENEPESLKIVKDFMNLALNFKT